MKVQKSIDFHFERKDHIHNIKDHKLPSINLMKNASL